MAHPYASQAKASQKRRLSALGAKAGKSFGSSSMYKKTSYPGKNAGSSTPMTISGGSARKRADQPAKFASGGLVSTGGRPKPKGKPPSTTNIIIANTGARGRRGGAGRRPAIPVPVNRPVPVPVPVGGAGGGLPPGAGGGAGPMPAGAPPGLMGAPSGPPPAMVGPPPGAGRPPGMAAGGLAGPAYHNWGEGYKAGGVVKKADGGEIKKRAMGGGKIIRGSNRPAAFKPGAVPGQPVVPLTGKRPQSLIGGLGAKKGGKVKKYQEGGEVETEPEPPEASSTTDSGPSGFNKKKLMGGIGDLAKQFGPPKGGASAGDSLARNAENLAIKTAAGTEGTTAKMLGSGGQKSAGFKPGALPYSSNTFKRGGKVHEDEAEDRKLIKSMLKEKKYAGGGFVPKNEKSKDSALIGSTYRNQGTGFNRGGAVKRADGGDVPTPRPDPRYNIGQPSDVPPDLAKTWNSQMGRIRSIERGDRQPWDKRPEPGSLPRKSGGAVKKAGGATGLGRLSKIAGAKVVPAKTEV